MRQIVEVHDLNPELRLLSILKVSIVIDVKFHGNKLYFFVFIIVGCFKLAMKIGLSLVFFSESVVKAPVDRKEVMGEVAFVADKFLVLTGGVEDFEAFFAL